MMEKKIKTWLLEYMDAAISLGLCIFSFINGNWLAGWAFMALFFRELKEKVQEKYTKETEEDREKWYKKYMEVKYGRKTENAEL